MSEIQRYETIQYPAGANPAFMPSRTGEFCHYADLLWYRRQYLMALIINGVVILACGVLAALLVTEKASRGPVQVPIGAAEKSGLIQEMQAMQKSRDDYKSMALNYKAQIKVLNAKVDGHLTQLEALQERGRELDKINKDQAVRMSTHQGVVLEAKRVLGVSHVNIVDR